MPTAFMVFSGEPKPLGGCEIYRGTLPLTYLSQTVSEWETGWAFYADLLEEHKRRGKSVWESFFFNNDVFIFPRMSIASSAPPELKDQIKILFSALKKSGKAIIYEVDDDFTNKHRKVVDGSAVAIANLCSAITVTTQYLGRLMETETGKKFYILPNYIEGALWHTPCEKRFCDIMTIGLTGSPSHQKDWGVVAPAIHRLSREYNSQVKFIIGGFFPDYLQGVENAEYVPGLPYDKYASLIKQCDVILAPVDPKDKFNMGKSPIKAVEGMSAARRLDSGEVAGAAVIATNNPVYRLALENEKTGILVGEHTPESWENAIRRLIVDHELRKRLQRNAFEESKARWQIEKNAYRWGKAYQEVLNKARKAAKK